MGSLSRRESGSNFGEKPGGYRTWGFFVTLCLIQGMGLLDFPVFGFVSHYDMTRVDVLLKLMFSQRY